MFFVAVAWRQSSLRERELFRVPTFVYSLAAKSSLGGINMSSSSRQVNPADHICNGRVKLEHLMFVSYDLR